MLNKTSLYQNPSKYYHRPASVGDHQYIDNLIKQVQALINTVHEMQQATVAQSLSSGYAGLGLAPEW